MRGIDRLTWELGLASVRQRWSSFVGAFVALAVGTLITAASIHVLVATTSTPSPGPQRFAAAESVVVPVDGFGTPLPEPAGLPRETVDRARRAGPSVVDRSFAVRSPVGAGTEAVGHGWSSSSLASYKLLSGHRPIDDHQIVVAADDTGSAHLGERVRVATPLGTAWYTVVGAAGRKPFEDAVFFTDAEAARLSPAVNAVAVQAPASAVRARVSGETAGVLAGDLRRVADPAAVGGLGRARSVVQMTTGLSVLVVVFVLIATFAFVVEQRSRELALLSLVGASPARIRRMVRAETVVVGAAAALLGCLLGIPASLLLRSWMVANHLAPEWFHVGFHPVALVIAFLVGIGGAVLGSAAASWRASRAQPLDALRETMASPRVMSPVRWILGGLILVVAITVALVFAVISPSSAANPGTYFEVPVLCAAGLAILSPVLVRPVARVVTWPLMRFGALALVLRQSTLNGGRRVAAIVTPVVLAVGMFGGMIGMQNSGRDAAARERTASIQADFVATPDFGGTFNLPAVSALRHAGGIRSVEVINEVVTLATKDGTVLDAVDARGVDRGALGDVVTPRVRQGSLDALPAGAIVVSRDLAASADLRIGQPLVARVGNGRRVPVHVAAVVDSVLGGGAAYVPSELPGSMPPGTAFLRTVPGKSATPQLRELREAGVRIEPVSTYVAQASQAEKEDSHLANVVILGIVMAYALLALVNTLVTSVSARRREMGALSLTGATHRQIVGIVVSEAVLAVAVGTLVSILSAGSVLGLQHVTLSRVIDHPPLALPWADLLQIVMLCTATAALAAIVAGWRTLARFEAVPTSE
ncbi:ABC transporter permease [Actinomadura luteofluorescens]|uniref:ABC transporter permease n=1 Tax=Actinomadura luteofluorescens TaxID=46163 RepID=UPI002164EA43|nr:ABC transporter permease [Actinomadura glauciflava]MCR3745662.1 putative ABC transport system permease protein [Actinomadura glauciflava]